MTDGVGNKTNSFIVNKKMFTTYETENQLESKTIVSPLPHAYNQQYSMDRNTLKTVSFHQFDDHRESIIIDDT